MGYFRGHATNRETKWASVRKSSCQFGMPVLARGPVISACDFRSFPFDETTVELGRETYRLQPTPDTLRPREAGALFSVLNAIDLAMTTTAVKIRSTWRKLHRPLVDLLKVDPNEGMLAYGQGMVKSIPLILDWMPRAYIAFPIDAWDRIFDICTNSSVNGVTYSQGLIEAYVTDAVDRFAYVTKFEGKVSGIYTEMYNGEKTTILVLQGKRGQVDTVRFPSASVDIKLSLGEDFAAGQLVASERLNQELPSNWEQLSFQERWMQLQGLVLGNHRHSVRLWFERKGVELQPAVVHFPSQIASVAALPLAISGRTFWDVSPALPYLHAGVEAMILPPILISHWCDLRGKLPGDVAYDFRPDDVRFEDYADQVIRKVTARKVSV
jgi:hypothetical protein